MRVAEMVRYTKCVHVGPQSGLYLAPIACNLSRSCPRSGFWNPLRTTTTPSNSRLNGFVFRAFFTVGWSTFQNEIETITGEVNVDGEKKLTGVGVVGNFLLAGVSDKAELRCSAAFGDLVGFVLFSVLSFLGLLELLGVTGVAGGFGGWSLSTTFRLGNGVRSRSSRGRFFFSSGVAALTLSVSLISGRPSIAFAGDFFSILRASCSLWASATAARLWDAARIAAGPVE